MKTPSPVMRIPHRSIFLTVGGMMSLAVLAGCGENGFALPGRTAAAQTEESTSTRLVERDVEAPEVFSVTEEGLWDGRPSLGGVWVAHPDVTDPERVIIRNQDNGKFVIGALFRRERDLPGPRLQISSDAAAALNILAGAPAPLNVTALRRAEAGDEAPAAARASTQTAPAAETLPEPSDIAEATLPPATSAAAGITAAPVPAPRPEPAAPARKSGGLAKPYVQIGIFSVEANAERAAKQMRGAGMLPTVKRSEINGKPFWRVVVGPAPSKSELDALLKKIKGEGFSDAYAVSN